MKKAKIFLTALTVLAVVGGALAFKARVAKQFFACNTISGKCTLNPTTLTRVTTTNIGGSKILYDRFNRDCVNDPEFGFVCTTLTTTFIDE